MSETMTIAERVAYALAIQDLAKQASVSVEPKDFLANVHASWRAWIPAADGLLDLLGEGGLVVRDCETGIDG